MRDHVLILEDDEGRMVRFRRTVCAVDPRVTVRAWNTAGKMIAELDEVLDRAIVVSLDHDLIASTPNADPGDGVDVARWLSAQTPRCPVIVHSSNGARALIMLGELELGGWSGIRVVPVGDGWIERDWRKELERCLRAKPDP